LYEIRDAIKLAKERTPTQRDRIAEALFIANKRYYAEEAARCCEIADAFIEGKKYYEDKNRKA